MSRTHHTPQDGADDSLDDYLDACRGRDAESATASSDAANSSGDEDGAPSAWRATAGNSPLRGRAAHTTARHRHSMHQLRTGRATTTPHHQPQQPLTRNHLPSGPFLPETVLEAARTEPARRLATTLRCPLTSCVRRPSPSAARYRTAAEHEAAQLAAATDAELRFLIDVLCAVRQVETVNYVLTHPPTEPDDTADGSASHVHWTTNTNITAAEEGAPRLSVSVLAVGRELLKTADLIGNVEHHLLQLTQLAEASRKTTSAPSALSQAARASLTRFTAFVRSSLHCYKAWVLRLQGYLGHLREAAAAANGAFVKPDDAAKTRRVGEPGSGAGSACSSRGVDGPLSGTSGASRTAEVLGGDGEQLLSLPLVVARNAEVLSRCLGVCESLSELHRPAQGESNAEARSIATARVLVDTLITEASIAQDASQLDEFRFHVMLLFSCAWPYVELVIDAFFGRAGVVDAVTWGRDLPLLFRTPLTPSRGAVDVLSLILDCADYPGRTSSSASSSSSSSSPSSAALVGLGGYDLGSAAASSRRYVLRSLSSFAQRRPRRKVQAAPPRAADHAVVDQQRERTVDEILADLVLGASEANTATARVGLAPSSITQFLTPQQQRRLCRALPTSRILSSNAQRDGDGDAPASAYLPPPVMELPTVIPLGLQAMTHELKQLQQWQTQQQQLLQPLCAADDRAVRAAHTDVALTDEEEETPPALQTGIVWSVDVSLGEDADGNGTPDVKLSCRQRNGDRTDGRKHKSLWVDAAVPVTRWVVAALLVPLALVAQRLQEHRLAALFTTTKSNNNNISSSSNGSSVSRTLATSLAARLLDIEKSHNEEAEETAAERMCTAGAPTAYALRRLGGQLGYQARLVSIPSTFSLFHAVKLLVDVALCRDTERVVRRFLERLTQEPHWWLRSSVDQFRRTGTASTFISATLADALRDKRFGGLVTLSVLPAEQAKPQADEEASEREVDVTGPASTPLDIFASFQLHFALPEELAVVLLPRALSLYMQNETGALQNSYLAAFWQYRRGLVGDGAGERSARAAALHLHATVGQPRDESVAAPAPTPSTRSGVAFSDVWSYVFGYLCSLQYAQIVLRQEQKRVQQQEIQDHALLASMGRSAAAARRVQHVSRGLGSVFFTLSFAIDTLLTFAQREAIIFVHDLEHTLQRGRDRTIGTCTNLCQEIDGLLLGLFVVCFPSRAPEMHTEKERMAVSATSEAVREAISRVLQLAFSPTSAPPSMMNARVNNAVDALVITIQSLRDATVLKARLQPLVTLFTFNRFYGIEQGTGAYQFR